MREHQIVITLKPEQFLEVQRLSRAAGAKSMGMFVRQRLLSALGIEGAPLVAAQQSVGPNVKRLTGELTRLHSQLKEFVAESLAPTYVTELPTPVYPTAPDEPEIPSPGQGLPGPGYDIDEYEEPQFEDEEEPFVAQSPPKPVSGEPRIFMESEDKLEQFARRAFAISPRLGAIELPGDRGSELPGDPAPGLRGDLAPDVREDPAPHREKSRAKEHSGRDPLEELLEDSSQVDSSAPASRVDPYADAEGTYSESGEDEDDDDEDVVLDVTLSIANLGDRSRQQQKPEESPPAPLPPPPPPEPPAGPIDLSGGPPPKRRQ